ncbi:hypothetical protein V501_03940 [Pseudogymnoascus sp. VKM F-4519 (FW-2642)]|nr:hypothetical protein V501_03940 [Pseudogymnoascus sp. VKM F-4519 (FW-2642)]
MDTAATFLNNISQWGLATADYACNAGAVLLPSMNGIEVLAIEAFPRRNYTFPGSPVYGTEPVTSPGFCNVTVTYTHPGWNDTINIISYLPFAESWNGKFLANGGAGYITGGEAIASSTMVPGLLDGFAVSTTDGGHSMTMAEMVADTSTWALTSPGNVNWPLLVDFASVALHDMATIGKAVTKAFYGSPPQLSYFFGSSTGGRQGHIIAQRYPKDFDGIIALFPAINWAKFVFANIYPSFVMEQLKEYPQRCEFEALRQAAISACDSLDGLEDGIISRPGLCQFDPHALVGHTFDCDGANAVFSSGAATIALATWNGPRSATGDFQWYGFGLDANISDALAGAAATKCNPEGKCAASPFPLSAVWVKYWVFKDPDFDLSTMTHDEWDKAYHTSVREYDSIIGTNDADLSEFKKAGGKMINWHGLQDQAIPTNGSVDYYERVLKRDPNAQDFYRFFLAPGASHSMSVNISPSRQEMMKAIQGWVENDTAPETLRAVGPGRDGTTLERDLCMYPRLQHYRGGDGSRPNSFICV